MRIIFCRYILIFQTFFPVILEFGQIFCITYVVFKLVLVFSYFNIKCFHLTYDFPILLMQLLDLCHFHIFKLCQIIVFKYPQVGIHVLFKNVQWSIVLMVRNMNIDGKNMRLISYIYEIKDCLLKSLILIHININNFKHLSVCIQSKGKVIILKLNKKSVLLFIKSLCKMNFNSIFSLL